jgi:hypothetical protein
MGWDDPSDWNKVSAAMPRDGTLIRLLCHGHAPDFRPFVCYGRFEGSNWTSYNGKTMTGIVEPIGWQFIQ